MGKIRITITVRNNGDVYMGTDVLYSIGKTDAWIYDLEDELRLSKGIHEVTIPMKQYRQLLQERTPVFTEVPSINNIVAEGILGPVIGCRVNGGGCNRCLITTTSNTYIVGADQILKRELDSTWSVSQLTLEDDLKFCKELDMNENYNYYSGSRFSVHGMGMRQIHIEIKE